jgi:hypothetical protein
MKFINKWRRKDWKEFLKPDWKKIIFVIPGILLMYSPLIFKLDLFEFLIIIYGPIIFISTTALITFGFYLKGIIFEIIGWSIFIFSFYIISCIYMSKLISKKSKIIYIILSVVSFTIEFLWVSSII